MDEGELQLRDSDESFVEGASDISKSDEVGLYSEYYDQSFTVKVTHKHGEKIGGDVVDTEIDDPMLGKRDIIHFKPKHVQSLQKPAVK